MLWPIINLRTFFLCTNITDQSRICDFIMFLKFSKLSLALKSLYLRVSPPNVVLMWQRYVFVKFCGEALYPECKNILITVTYCISARYLTSSVGSAAEALKHLKIWRSFPVINIPADLE